MTRIRGRDIMLSCGMKCDGTICAFIEIVKNMGVLP
jgi:hypothetical protein